MNIMKTFRLLAICTLVLAAGCGKDPKIDKVYNTVYINSAASSFQGSLTQGQAVAQGTKITLAYTNGLGKSAQVLLPEVNGLYCDPCGWLRRPLRTTGTEPSRSPSREPRLHRAA